MGIEPYNLAPKVQSGGQQCCNGVRGRVVLKVALIQSSQRVKTRHRVPRVTLTRRRLAHQPVFPAPAGAIILLLPIYAQDLGLHWPSLTPLVLVYTVAIGLLMVSRVPTFSSKLIGQKIAREHVPPIFVLAALFIALLLTYPSLTLAAGSLIYLNSLSNPFVLDDEGTILENEQIRNLGSLAVLTPERELPVAGRQRQAVAGDLRVEREQPAPPRAADDAGGWPGGPAAACAGARTSTTTHRGAPSRASARISVSAGGAPAGRSSGRRSNRTSSPVARSQP